MNPSSLTLLIIPSIAPVLFSCSEEKIPTFRVAIEESADKALSKPRPLRWQAPGEWVKEKPGEFQIALYRLDPGTLVSVSKLAGDGGGIPANVNRWRQQIGLEPALETGSEMIALEEEESNARWFELTGENEGILATVIPLDAETWFFKLTAPAGELEKRRSEFMAFLKTIQVGSESPQPEKPGIEFDIPEGWEKSEGNELRLATFRIPSTDGIDGDVSVIPLPGEVGTTLENVNRWRAQLRLPALESDTDPALGTTIKGSSGAIFVTHMVSEEALFSGNRHGAISTAILKAGEFTWFFKLAGGADLVHRNRDKFETFVRSAVIP